MSPRRSQRSKAQPHRLPDAALGKVPSPCNTDGSGLSLGGETRLQLLRGSRPGCGRGEDEDTVGGRPMVAGIGCTSATRKAVLTLREFSMLISQPSKCKNWAMRTSRSATAWYERSSPARKASHSCLPSFHSVMNVPVGQQRGQAWALPR